MEYTQSLFHRPKDCHTLSNLKKCMARYDVRWRRKTRTFLTESRATFFIVSLISSRRRIEWFYFKSQQYCAMMHEYGSHVKRIKRPGESRSVGCWIVGESFCLVSHLTRRLGFFHFISSLSLSLSLSLSPPPPIRTSFHSSISFFSFWWNCHLKKQIIIKTEIESINQSDEVWILPMLPLSLNLRLFSFPPLHSFRRINDPD